MKNEKTLNYKDVMYGDIVAIEDFSIDRDTYDLVRTVVPCKVIGFTDGNTILEYTSKENEQTLTVMQEFMPYDATKEILEKNGFEEISKDVFQYKDDKTTVVQVSLNQETPFVYCKTLDNETKLNGIYSIHIIQHVCKNCFLEKEFEI